MQETVQYRPTRPYTRQEVRANYTPVPNLFLRNLNQLSAVQAKILFFIIGKNAGYDHPSKEFSVRYVASSLNEPTSTVQVNLTRLIERGVLIVVGHGRRGIRRLEFFNPASNLDRPAGFADRTVAGTEGPATVPSPVQNRTADGTDPYTPEYKYKKTKYKTPSVQGGSPELKPQRSAMRHNQKSDQGNPAMNRPTDRRPEVDPQLSPLENLTRALHRRPLPPHTIAEITEAYRYTRGNTLVFDPDKMNCLEVFVEEAWPDHVYERPAAGGLA